MNRIQTMFRGKKTGILSFYCTAGYPGINDTVAVIRALEAAGADMVEIGIPFSDPLADGPVIQQSSHTALDNGMSVPELFHQLREVRKYVRIPLLLMGYLNPVLQYGVARFCRDAAACGIDGLIIPDLPLAEYKSDWRAITSELELNMVFLVAPGTTPERIKIIDRLSGGFIYLVATTGVTGGSLVWEEQLKEYFTRVQDMQLHHPLIAGFGIRTREDFGRVCRYTQGAVIGSGLIRVLEECNGDFRNSIGDFVQSFR